MVFIILFYKLQTGPLCWLLPSLKSIWFVYVSFLEMKDIRFLSGLWILKKSTSHYMQTLNWQQNSGYRLCMVPLFVSHVVLSCFAVYTSVCVYFGVLISSTGEKLFLSYETPNYYCHLCYSNKAQSRCFLHWFIIYKRRLLYWRTLETAGLGAAFFSLGHIIKKRRKENNSHIGIAHFTVAGVGM